MRFAHITPPAVAGGPSIVLVVVLATALATGGTLLAAPAAHARVVINEVLYDPEGTDTGLEFVELLNCGSEGVLMTGWVLASGNGANPDDWTNEWIGGDLDYLEAGGILLIGESDVVPAPHYVTPIDLQNGPDGLRLTDGVAPVDVVGWGEPLFSEYYEGAPAPDVPSGMSLARSPDCYDNDDNSVDLVPAAPTPGARNSATHDLALSVRHSGRRVFAAGETVELACVVMNVGALPTSGEPSTIELRGDNGFAVATSLVTGDLAPRDSVDVVLEWRGPPDGYHRLFAELTYGSDCEPGNNEAPTSVTVGGFGWDVALNEFMHSPDDLGTEWVELANVAGAAVEVAGWLLGDDVEAHAIPDEASAVVPPGGFLLLAKSAEVVSPSASCEVLEPDDWEALSADDTVVLLDEFGTVMDRVTYERGWGGDRGMSLERVRPDMPPDDPGNWGASVSPEGGTPGRTNSIHLEHAPTEGALSVSPNPFTPDGDGENDRTVVRLELPVARATARVTVFDLDGRMRALLADHVAVPSSSELLWDGSGSDGETLPSGLYVILMEAIDARAGVYTTAKTAVGVVRQEGE